MELKDTPRLHSAIKYCRTLSLNNELLFYKMCVSYVGQWKILFNILNQKIDSLLCIIKMELLIYVIIAHATYIVLHSMHVRLELNIKSLLIIYCIRHYYIGVSRYCFLM